MQKQCTSLVYGKGKTTLPKSIRNYLHVNDGSAIVYTIVDGNIVISGEDRLANSLKKMVTQATKGKSLVAELLNDRKREAQND